MIETNLTGYKITIYFKSGDTCIVERKVTDTSELINYLTSLDIEESIFTENQNPIGVINSNTFKLTLTSLDRSLVPTNKQSAYFGNMNSTAEVEIELYIPDADGNPTVNFGRYYVSTWTSNTDSNNKYQVVIEGTDLLGILIKNATPYLEIKKNMTVVDLLNNIRGELINIISDSCGFEFNFLNVPKYNVMQYNDIDADDINTFLNIICQSMLLNLYIDRDNSPNNKKINIMDSTLKLSSASETLTDTKDITYASLNKGNLVNYTGVKVNYSLGNINTSSELARLTGITLSPGENELSNINTGGSTFKIDAIVIQTDNETAVEYELVRYNKRNVTLKINNHTQVNVVATIIIYGQSLTENILSVTKLSTVESNELLEVTNNLLPLDKVDSYAYDLLTLVENRGESIKVRGLFNPAYLKLNTVVHVDCQQSIYVAGDFRCVGLSWSLGSNLKCEARLVKA